MLSQHCEIHLLLTRVYTKYGNALRYWSIFHTTTGVLIRQSPGQSRLFFHLVFFVTFTGILCIMHSFRIGQASLAHPRISLRYLPYMRVNVGFKTKM
jgi:hypothetical protein